MSRRTASGRARPAGPALIPGLALGLVLGLTGCGADDPQPGPEAGTAACTALIQRLPERVLDRSRTDLDVAGAAAWGDPPIVLRCGVPAGGPTSDRCLELNGQEWTFSETKDAFRFLTHGRTPTVEVRVPASVDRTTASGAAIDLAAAVAPLPRKFRCP